jgi:hypothetical protein
MYRTGELKNAQDVRFSTTCQATSRSSASDGAGGAALHRRTPGSRQRRRLRLAAARRHHNGLPGTDRMNDTTQPPELLPTQALTSGPGPAALRGNRP